MDLTLWVKAAIMGIVEGLTEFLPVSSTGHLILAGSLLGFTDDKSKVFDIAIQSGAIFAVVLVYWQRLRDTFVGLGSDVVARRFALNVAIGFVPAVILGLLFGKMIKAHLFTPVVVATTFILGGFVILWAERRQSTARIETVDDMRPLDALKVGLVQCLALVPGTSRSGATIIGGMLLGLSRKAATDFSFFLSIPTLDRRRPLQPVEGAGAAVGGRHPAVRGRPRVLVPGRMAVRALAAALHLDPHVHAVRVVPDRVRHRRAGDGLQRTRHVGRLRRRGVWRCIANGITD